MRYQMRWILCVFVASCACGTWAADEDDIFALFKTYVKAVVAKDGKTAAGCVDAKSVAWYQEAINEAISADKAAIIKMPASRQVCVLKMRLEFKKDELAKMTGRDAIEVAVNRGWTGIESENQLRLARVKVEGDTAAGFIPGSPKEPLTHFKKESGKWVLELWRMMTFGDTFFTEAAKQAGMTQEKLILEVLREVGTVKVEESIYEPLK